jgi:oxygen-dependent protoporphyrinogen oxidase
VSRPSVVVLGGGVAGLAAAYELSGGVEADPDAPRIELLEANAEFGGPLRSVEWSGRHLDVGPDGFLARRPEALALIRDLGLEGELEWVDASGASLYLDGELREIPDDAVMGIPPSSASMRSLGGLSRSALVHARRDELAPRRFRADGDVAIGEIVRHKLGDEIAYRVVEPMIGGIQAGRIDQLSAQSVFPPLLDAARRGGSLLKALASLAPSSPPHGPSFASLQRGMGSLPQRLVEILRERGVVLRPRVAALGVRANLGEYPLSVETSDTVTRAHLVIAATPAPVSAGLVASLAPESSDLTRIDSASAAMISLVYSDADLQLPAHGTGVLIPLQTAWGTDTHLVTAFTFLDRKWPHLRRGGEILLRAHVGRIDDHRLEDYTDDELGERVAAEVNQVLKATGAPRARLVQRWPRGLPQYYVGHAERVARVRAVLEPRGVLLAGSPYDGVGIPASIGSGRRAGVAALDYLRARV